MCSREATESPLPRTNGELVEGDGCSIVSQCVANTDGDLVLDSGEQVHVADMAAVLKGWVLLTGHSLGAMPGRGKPTYTITHTLALGVAEVNTLPGALPQS